MRKLIDAPDLMCQMKRVLGMSNLILEDECSTVVPRLHGSGNLSQYANLTERDNAILDVITREEYAVLGPYL